MQNIEGQYERSLQTNETKASTATITVLLPYCCVKHTRIKNLRNTKDHKKVQLNLKKTAGPSVNKKLNVKGNTNY